MGPPLKLGWINLSNFYGDMEGGTVSASADVERLLRRLIKENIHGLVFDLRDNGGGSLDEAVKLTGLFVPSGPVVQAKDWRGSISWKDSEAEKPVYDGPMIVLVNKASASASEILAAALQDYRRASSSVTAPPSAKAPCRPSSTWPATCPSSAKRAALAPSRSPSRSSTVSPVAPPSSKVSSQTSPAFPPRRARHR
jgi:hypothetical protein